MMQRETNLKFIRSLITLIAHYYKITLNKKIKFTPIYGFFQLTRPRFHRFWPIKNRAYKMGFWTPRFGGALVKRQVVNSKSQTSNLNEEGLASIGTFS